MNLLKKILIFFGVVVSLITVIVLIGWYLFYTSLSNSEPREVKVEKADSIRNK